MPSKPHQPHLISEPESENKLTPEEQAEKEAYLERLREYLQDPEFRQIPGFPIGEDEDILALSDPPYYTACPNPFLPEIIERWQVERANLREELGLPDDANDNGNDKPIYHREPFASDVSEGKNNLIYNAHSYHTKVPHPAIMRYILHYTDPGDIVFDGFCGTGMTGVAAQLCGDRNAVTKLGYFIDSDGLIFEKMGDEKPISRLGARKTILNDLSPAATFIAYNYNTPVDVKAFEREANRILEEVEEECSWMYETWHPHCDDPNRVKGKIRFTVWSDVFVCPQCSQEMVFWDVVVDHENNHAIRRYWPCPHCETLLSKNPSKNSGALKPEHVFESNYDSSLGKIVSLAKQVPVLIQYNVGKSRYEKPPGIDDLALIQKIKETDIPYPFPINSIPKGDKTSDPFYVGITHVHHFYTNRSLLLMAKLWKLINGILDERLRRLLYFLYQSLILGYTKLNRYGATHYSQVNRYLSGTLYVSSMTSEVSLRYAFEGKLSRLIKAFASIDFRVPDAILTTQSSTQTEMMGNSLDYIFVDPPFGANLMYSELNFLWESWLGVLTNAQPEAIINKSQRKNLPDYTDLMESCFCEFYRLLKPNHWMTVEFHNSKNFIWNGIQEAILRAGFVVADVRSIDKKQGTFNQVTASGAVKQDLVISAYKPRSGFEKRFLEQAGTTDGAWEFIRQHLAQLPVVVKLNGQLETLSERQDYLLFDRMVAFHIQRGATVPLSAAEFYAGLEERFTARDGMYFLPDQVPEYDRARLQAESVAQLSLFVSDEKTAIQWLRQQLDPKLGGEPQTYQDIQPKFLRQLHQAKHEDLPELGILLEQSFLQDEKDRWYVPDPHKISDLEKIRRKALLREFKTYLGEKKKLKQFRTEAVRTGFADAYHRKDFPTILQVAQRLPNRVLQEDPDLLMYYDAASLRSD